MIASLHNRHAWMRAHRPEARQLLAMLTPLTTRSTVARQLGCSPQNVEQIELRALWKIKHRMLDAVRRTS